MATLFPIGTIVILKDNDQNMMVAGYGGANAQITPHRALSAEKSQFSSTFQKNSKKIKSCATFHRKDVV